MPPSHSQSSPSILSVETLQRFCQGDAAAFHIVHQAFNHRLFAFLRVSFSSLPKQDVEDILQDLWLEILRTRDRFNPADGHGGFSGWVHQLARRRSIDQTRRRSRDAVATDPEQLTLQSLQGMSPEDQLQQSEQLRQFQDCLQRLPADWRRLIVGKYIDEKTTADLADQEDLPQNTVSTRLHRGKQLLQDCLNSKHHPEPPAGHLTS